MNDEENPPFSVVTLLMIKQRYMATKEVDLVCLVDGTELGVYVE